MNTQPTISADVIHSAIDEMFTIAALVKSAEIAAHDFAQPGESQDLETVDRINRLCMAAWERVEATRKQLSDAHHGAYFPTADRS